MRKSTNRNVGSGWGPGPRSPCMTRHFEGYIVWPVVRSISNTLIAGVDACKNGWVIASQGADGRPAVNLVPHFGKVLDYEHMLVVVDIPIGLLDRGTRLADRAARGILKGRSCCVFTAPLRPMLACRDYPEAKECRQKIDGKGITKQAWAITKKIGEIDRLISSEAQSHIREGHPEVSFAQMNRGAALARSKHFTVRCFAGCFYSLEFLAFVMS